METQLEIKNKITFLHNNLREGQYYEINGFGYTYAGFKPIVKGGENTHIFHRNGEKLALTREDLIVLDVFNEL